MVSSPDVRQPRFPEVFFPSKQNFARSPIALRGQAELLVKTWWPLCEREGLTQAHSQQLWSKWCLAVGSILRETTVDEEQFFDTLRTFAGNMIQHLRALKYYMHSPGWEPVVERVLAADDPEFEFIMRSGAAHVVSIDSGRPPDDPTDDVRMTFLHVYLPNAETPGEARIRVPFAAKGAEKPSAIEVINDVTQTLRVQHREALEHHYAI